MSSLIDRLDEPNRSICKNAMEEHDKHYRALCCWIRHRIKKRGKNRCLSGPGQLSEILSEGHTVACCIWEKYTGERS